jgi:hypothetical protein
VKVATISLHQQDRKYCWVVSAKGEPGIALMISGAEIAGVFQSGRGFFSILSE